MTNAVAYPQLHISVAEQVQPQPKYISDLVKAAMDCIEIARDGDLLLRVQETSTLRVSALVLRTTSEVFGAMLGPHFAEGRAFRSNSTTETPRLDLPEDDAQGMKLLCCVLHQRNDLLEDDITVAQLHSLAVVADKYACTKAVQYTATCWFSRMSNQTIKNHAIDIISASYLLNHAESFARMTNLVAKECKDNVLRLLAAIAPASETVVTLQGQYLRGYCLVNMADKAILVKTAFVRLKKLRPVHCERP